MTQKNEFMPSSPSAPSTVTWHNNSLCQNKHKFQLVFSFTFVFLGISFFSYLLLQNILSKEVFQNFDVSENFSENVTLSSSEEINLQTSTGWIIVVLKMYKMKTYV